MGFMDGLRALGAPREKGYRPAPPAFVRVGSPLDLGNQLQADKAASAGMRANVWVYRCIVMTMELGSTVPFAVQRMGGNGKWSFDFRHPLSRVLDTWNDQWGPQESIALCLAYLSLGGNTLIGKYPGGMNVKQIFAENPSGVRPVIDDVGDIDYYEHPTSQGPMGRWDARDVCHGRLPNPENRYWGLGRLTAIAKEVDTDVRAMELNKLRVERGGVPDGLLIDGSIMNATQRAEAQRDIDTTWREAAGLPFVTGAGVDWIQLGMSQRDLQFLEGRKFSKNAIVQAFGYLPQLFGEDATFNNMGAADRARWTGAIIPLLNVLANMFTRGMIPREERETTRIFYDTSGVDALRDDLTAKIAGFKDLIAVGVPIDTAASLMGIPMEELPDGLGKVSFGNSSMRMLADIVKEQETNDGNPQDGGGGKKPPRGGKLIGEEDQGTAGDDGEDPAGLEDSQDTTP